MNHRSKVHFRNGEPGCNEEIERAEVKHGKDYDIDVAYHHDRGFHDCFDHEPNVPFRSVL